MWALVKFKHKMPQRAGCNLGHHLKYLHSGLWQAHSGQLSYWWSDPETLLGETFVTIAMAAFNQFQLSLSNALRTQIGEFSCSCLIEASKMRCIKMVGNSLWSHCSSCSSPDPSNVPPAETYSGNTCIYPVPVSPFSIVSLIPSRTCSSLLSLWVLQLSWACKSEDLPTSNSDSKESGMGDEELWAGEAS